MSVSVRYAAPGRSGPQPCGSSVMFTGPSPAPSTPKNGAVLGGEEVALPIHDAASFVKRLDHVAADVPLADVAGDISARRQGLRQQLMFVRDPISVVAILVLVPLHAEPLTVGARHQAATAWCTDR